MIHVTCEILEATSFSLRFQMIFEYRRICYPMLSVKYGVAPEESTRGKNSSVSLLLKCPP